MLRREAWEKIVPIVCYFALIIVFDIESDSGCEHSTNVEKHECAPPAQYCGSIITFFWRLLHVCGNADALLAIFTVALTLVTALLWFSTRAIAIDGRENAANQTKLSRITARIAIKEARLSRQTFIASHRPELRVRQVFLHPDEGTNTTRAHVELVNVGTSAGTIVVAAIRFVAIPRTRALPSPPEYDGQETFLLGADPGQVNALKSREAVEDWCLRDRRLIAYCFGFVLYDDVSHKRRTIAFCRRLITTKEVINKPVFARLDKADPLYANHEDYEYSE